jgi:polar amino acid transport system substrate-binding protein
MRWNAVLRRAGLAVIALLWSAAAAPAADWSTIRVGTEGAYKPFNYYDASGKLTGLDIDIVEALCQRLKARCVFVAMQLDGLQPALLDGKVDAVATGWSMTEKRRKVVDFTDKYYTRYARFMTCGSETFTDISPAGLKGRVIGTQGGTANDDYLAATYKDSDVRRYKSMDDAYSDLAAGRVDLVLSSEASSYDFTRSEAGKDCRFAGPRLADKPFGLGVGIGLRKTDTDLRDLLNGALKAIIADGTYDAVVKKYFPFSIY